MKKKIMKKIEMTIPDYVRDNWFPSRTKKEGYRPQYERLLTKRESY